MYIGQKNVFLGETVLAEISILNKQYFTNKLYQDLLFTFNEGAHKIGNGKILEIINNSLK